MPSIKFMREYRGIQILTDGYRYYVPDGFGDLFFFNSEDEAIAHIDGTDIEED